MGPNWDKEGCAVAKPFLADSKTCTGLVVLWLFVFGQRRFVLMLLFGLADIG